MSKVSGKDRAKGAASVLFVPGSRPERFAKAAAAGADVVCVDLEDAVPADGKEAARHAAIAAIAPRIAIRVNGVATAAGLADLLALAAAPELPELIFVPMVESAEELRIARAVLGEAAALVPLIETPRGLRLAAEIASAPRVAAMMFGGGHLSAPPGVGLARRRRDGAHPPDPPSPPRASALHSDVPFIALDDAEGLERETRLAKRAGFQAKAAIHPAQLEAIHAVMRPGAAEVAEAEAALAAYEAAGGGAVRFNGRMLEAPMVRRYAAIVAMAGNRETEDA